MIDGATWWEVVGCLRAVVAFALLLAAPGYCLGWATGVMGFRRRGEGGQVMWSVALSFVVAPIAVVLLAKYGSLNAVCWAAMACGVGGVVLAWRAWRRGRKVQVSSLRCAPIEMTATGRGVRWGQVAGVCVAAGWVVFVIAEMVVVGVGSRLYLSVTVFDHALRTAFVDAVMRTGVPPVNPLYWPGHGAPMRYYYFWYVLTAAAAKLAGATARQGMIASVVWAGFGLAAVVGLFCGEFLGAGEGVFRGLKPGPISETSEGVSGLHPTHRDGAAMDGAPGTWESQEPVAGLSAAAQEGVSGRDDRSFSGLRSGSILGSFSRSRMTVGLGLLLVTGLDVVPAVVKAVAGATGVAGMGADGDMEWWSQAQVTSWLDSVLWVPHHVAGLVCCVVGFLLVWKAGGGGGAGVGDASLVEKDETPRAGWARRLGYAALAGAGFASAFGLSVWVAVAFAIVMAGWAVWVLVWERGAQWVRSAGGQVEAASGRVRAAVLVGAGLAAAVLLVPYLGELRAEVSGAETAGSRGADSAGGAGHLLQFGVRHMVDPEALLGVPGFARLAERHPVAEDWLAGLVLLAPGYVTELGFYGLVLVWAAREARRGRLDEAQRTALVLTGMGLLVATFLRSTVVENNDFGTRASLIAQFFLLMLAVGWVREGPGAWGQGPKDGGQGSVDGEDTGFSATAAALPPVEMRRLVRGGRWMRRVMWGMVGLGLAGTVYQAVLLRVYLPAEERMGAPEMAGLAERAMAWRNGFEAMDARVAKEAVVQFNPVQPGENFNYAEILLVRRQMASALPVCAAAFGGDPEGCAGVAAGVERLFVGNAERAGSGALTAAQARRECGRLGITELVATRWDGVWGDRAGWVWGLPAVVDTGEVRVVNCAGGRSGAGRAGWMR